MQSNQMRIFFKCVAGSYIDFGYYALWGRFVLDAPGCMTLNDLKMCLEKLFLIWFTVQSDIWFEMI